jgi:serine phosphatase RsbU (regulator of sigma subunit)
MIIMAVGTLVDMLLACCGYAGVSIIPFTVVLTAIPVSLALVWEHIDSDRERQRMGRELQLASDVQQSLLPKKPLTLPGFDVDGRSRPAEETGGDNYDLFQLPDGKWIVTLSDASGHGLGPALVIAETRAMLRAVGMRSDDPIAVLLEVSKLLEAELPEGQFVTSFIGLLDPASATLCYASAGHGPIIFFNAAAREFDQESATGPPLPLFPLVPSEICTRRFEAGDLLVLVSDGLWEVTRMGRGEREQQFGISRLVEHLREAVEKSASEIVESTYETLDRFVTSGHHQDDQTMLVLKKS